MSVRTRWPGLIVLLALLVGAAATEAEGPSFGSVTFAERGADGTSVDASFRFAEGTREVFARFPYSGLTGKVRWSWRLTREGGVLDEAYERLWNAGSSGTHVLPVSVSGEAGLYDLDLYLDGKLTRISSFVIGRPEAPPARVLQADDFDLHRPGWGAPGRVEGGRGSYTVDQGRAVIALDRRDGPVWKRSGQVFGDTVIEVDAGPLAGSRPVAYGVLARYKDDNNFYALLVNTDGEFAVVEMRDGRLSWEQKWKADGAIHKRSTNRLRVLADDSLLRFYANGVLLGGLREVYRGDGQAGFLVFGRGGPASRVAFDNWRVWSLPGRYEYAGANTPWVRCAFATPGVTTVAEARDRLGEPNVDFPSSAAEGEIDVLATRGSSPESILRMRKRATARGTPVVDVRVLEWDVGRWPPAARFVFRADRLWYATCPTSPSETTPEQLAVRYGRAPAVSTVTRQVADVIYTIRVYAYPELGVAYTRAYGDRIERKLVFPPSAAPPLGPAVE